MSINKKKKNFGKGYWKFNNSLLHDKTFVTKFTKYWLDLIEGIELSLELWDHLKEQIKKFCIHYSKQKAKVKRSVLRYFEKSYHRLQYFENKNPGVKLKFKLRNYNPEITLVPL